MKRLAIGLAIAAWAVFVAACFLPAVTTVGDWEVDLEGWQAAVMSVGAIDDFRESPFLTVLTILAALTNVVMLASPWAIYRARRRGAWVFVVAGYMAAAINVGVFAAWHAGQNIRFGWGYVAWLVSFALITAALQVTLVNRARLSGCVA